MHNTTAPAPRADFFLVAGTFDGDVVAEPASSNDPVTTPREALRRMIERADLLIVEGESWLLIRAPQPLLELLAELDAEAEDLEDDAEAEDDFRNAPHVPERRGLIVRRHHNTNLSLVRGWRPSDLLKGRAGR